MTISKPAFTPVPFANGAGSGYRNDIPEASQTGVTPGAASYTDGFPPVTFEPIASGGVPPFGADFNGILYALSVKARWNQAGGNYPFDSSFATTIGGYPVGATVQRADGKGKWLNTTSGNTTDPDSASASGWVELRANNGTTSIAMSAGDNTPTLDKLGAQVLVLTGAPASTANLILPLRAGAQWLVLNKTTGAGQVNVQGATGGAVVVPQGTGYQVFTDGTDYYGTAADVSGLYLPIDGTAKMSARLASSRNFSMTGPVTAAGVGFDGSGNVTLNTAIADGALSIAKTSGLQTALDAKAPLNSPQFTGRPIFPGAGVTVGTDFGLIYSSAPGAVSIRSGVSGAVYFNFGNNGHFNALNGGATFAGAVTATGGFQNSDRRLKTNIQPRQVQRGFALKLARMFVEWDRIADGVHDVGLIAQRVKAIASRYVIRGEKQGRKAGMLAIDKSGIALEASMDCALQLDEQAKTIRALLRRIEKLEKAR